MSTSTLEPAPPSAPLAFYTVEEAANLLSVNKALIYREIHAGRLKALRIGHKVLRISQQALSNYIEIQSQTVAMTVKDQDGLEPQAPIYTEPKVQDCRLTAARKYKANALERDLTRPSLRKNAQHSLKFKTSKEVADGDSP